MFIIVIFGVVFLPVIGWLWYDFDFGRAPRLVVQTSIRALALLLTTAAVIGFLGTTVVLLKHGSGSMWGYFRLATAGAGISILGGILGLFSQSVRQKVAIGITATLTAVFWLMFAVLVLPVS